MRAESTQFLGKEGNGWKVGIAGLEIDQVFFPIEFLLYDLYENTGMEKQITKKSG